MEEVVDEIAQQYLEGVRFKSEYLSARCPFHGPDRHPSFWMHRGTGKFGCWACGSSGSSLVWFLKELGVRRRDIDYAIKEAEKDRNHRAKIAKLKKQKAARADFRGTSTLPDNILGLWDYCPVALLEDGFQEEVLKAHDVGFDQTRLRITFPIRDVAGALIGVSGRTVDGSFPKYKVYQGKHDIVTENGDTIRVPGELGEWFPDYSSKDIRNHLYRENFVYEPCFNGKPSKADKLIVVEGYKAALWLVQMGYAFTVALMGSKMTPTQERLLRRMGMPIYILLDNNEAGQVGADYMADRLGNCTKPVYRCFYPDSYGDDAQPDDLKTVEEIEEVLQTAPRAVRRIRWQNFK